MKLIRELPRCYKKVSVIEYICLIIFITIFFAPVVSASDVLVWQGQYYTGTTFNKGTYDFNFSVYDNLTAGNICYSNTTTLSTGNWGEWKTEQYNVSISCANVSKDYFLNINIDGTDQTPRKRVVVWTSLRKDVDEVSKGGLVLEGILSGLSPLKLQDEINFLKSDGTITSALYNAPRESTSVLPSVFADSLIHDIINETNDYGMQECFWDENTATMQMCISGAYLPQRATTISRSLQIVGNTTSKLVNENFTLCEGNNYLDCNPDTTGADLLVEDDIESIGSIFSQENITADDSGFFSYLGSLVNRITKLFVQDININGTITFEGKDSTYTIRTTNDNDTLRIFSGSNLDSSSKIKLFGVNSSTSAGDVVIEAGNASGSSVRLRTGEGSSENRIVIQSDGDIIFSNLNGTGNDYLCVASNGRVFRSNTAC